MVLTISCIKYNKIRLLKFKVHNNWKSTLIETIAIVMTILIYFLSYIAVIWEYYDRHKAIVIVSVITKHPLLIIEIKYKTLADKLRVGKVTSEKYPWACLLNVNIIYHPYYIYIIEWKISNWNHVIGINLMLATKCSPSCHE